MTNAYNSNSRAEDIVIARVIRPRGIRGEVACAVETDFPGRFESLDEVTLWMADDTRVRLRIQDRWFHKGRLILKFEGYDSMTAAQGLAGARLVIAELSASSLGEGQFFEHHLIGSEAVTSDGRSLGRVARLMRTGGTDLLVVQGEDGQERLIPFADEICTNVDVEAKRIRINPPEGLLEL